MTTATHTPLEAALTYAARNWRVVPIGAGTKWPDLAAWQREATTDPHVIANWYTERPGRGVGIATGQGSGIFVLDVDTADGKVGAESFTDLEAAHGPLPATVEAVTGTGGRHLYYRHPPGLELNNSAGRLGPDLDIRANGGQVVAAPTIHPDTGQPYAWDLEHHPDDVPIADAPAWLLALLEPPAPVEVGPRGDYSAAALAWDRFNYHPAAADEVARMLGAAGWAEARTDRDGARYFTRPGKRTGISASLGKVAPGVLYVFTGSAPPFEAERSYDPSDVLAILVHDGDRAAADRQLVELGYGTASFGIDRAELEAWVNAQAPVEVEGLNLPEAFWNARPALQQIRQAAHARLVSADAVLGAVLTRLAAFTPHTVELPPLVGSAMGLTFYAAPVGPPSSGKSAALGVAQELLPAPQGSKVLDGLPIGSGEGFVDTLFEMVDEIDPATDKKVKVKRQTRSGAVFVIDEGTVLADLGARSGTTIMSTLRTAFTHGTLGATNASIERRRLLEGHLYVYGVTMGIQPEKAGPLLSDAAAGTPQRFLWLKATDPTIPDTPVDWPGALEWAPPSPTALNRIAVPGVAGYQRHRLHVDPAITAELRAERLAGGRGQAVVEEGDAHRGLVRLKAAALLAILEQRLELDPSDWDLAGQLVDASRAVRLAVEHSLRTVEAASNRAYGKRLAEREAVVEGSAEARALTSGAKVVARRVRRHHDTHPDGTCARRCVTLATSGEQRRLAGLDAILEAAEAHGWIEAVGDRWKPGESSPS